MEQENQSQPQPTVITLDDKNSVVLLTQYIEFAQQKGAFVLAEAELLKRTIDYLVNNVPDKELNEQLAKQILIQAANKGQRAGAYTLNDAALLHKVVQFVSNSLQAPGPEQVSTPTPAPTPAPTPVQTSKPVQSSSKPTPVKKVVTEDDDLSLLAEPIPLKPKEI